MMVLWSGTVSFWWKVSSEQGYDKLRFYIDDAYQTQISGEQDWQQKTYEVTGSGSHTLKWKYVKDSSTSDGSDCGWVDWLQWDDGQPQSILPPADWSQASYAYDPMGRRIERKVDNWTQRYVYDGDMVIAEYDGEGTLLRKYVHAGTDRPICAIEVADGNAVSYYHYDGLGSVIALSDADGDTIQTYEYAIYGRVAAEDPNHPNPYLFTGQRLDIETGLYYYKARCYNPHIGPHRPVHADRPDRVSGRGQLVCVLRE
jgi:RHS repeat-associated protein